ncbi:hypothetical protein C8J56DRAFT_65106 [Mycena floridula]|nr:hypothetical protein C8J56DRAFT_65106 [Mycena floridula]
MTNISDPNCFLNHLFRSGVMLYDLREDPVHSTRLRFSRASGQNLLDILSINHISTEFLLPGDGDDSNLTQLDYSQLATYPPTSTMTLQYPTGLDTQSPCSFKISASDGLTVLDVLHQIHRRFFTNSGVKTDFDQLEALQRGKVVDAYQKRCAENPNLLARGILRVDFLALEGNVICIGLEKQSRDGIVKIILAPDVDSS